MNSIKQSLTDLKKSTPKNVQWLLMAAAFIIVLILLTLLLTGKKKNDSGIIKNSAENNSPAILKVSPNELDWSAIRVGETVSQKFVVTGTVPIKISAVRLSPDIDGLSKKSNCKKVAQVSDLISCTIDLDYKPTSAMDISATTVLIDWRGSTLPEKMNQTEKIAIAIGATENVKKPSDGDISAKHDTAKTEEIKKEIETIAPVINFDDTPEEIEEESDEEIEEPTPKPVQKTAPVSEPSTPVAVEKCSDFAFPGYSSGGQQIGWIKPENGGYKFHPFSDTDCNAPTGNYNPDNGIITDIKNPAKKIGTDAEHIGRGNITNGTLPKLSNPVQPRNVNKAPQLETANLGTAGKNKRVFTAPVSESSFVPSTIIGGATISSQPYDRSFVLRQYKPIAATIVSEIRADASTINNLPIRATVDRNVYADNGRTIIVPAGTLMLGYVTGSMPGPYKTIGRMQLQWYQFIRPDGVEFNFAGGDANNPFSGDSQGRVGVPGYGSSDYLEQFVMPMITAIVPAAVNMIAPISDKFVNQIDLDNNTVTQSGQVRSSELAKNEIVQTWNKIANKLMVDMMDNTVPPFSIASGTRITVFSPTDLIVTCGEPDANSTDNKKCAIAPYNPAAPTRRLGDAAPVYADGSWTGQVRSFDLSSYCADGKIKPGMEEGIKNAGLDYRTVSFYCQTTQYQAINNVKQDAVYKNQGSDTNKKSVAAAGGIGSDAYNQQILGLKYQEDGSIKNPFEKEAPPPPPAAPGLTCPDDGMAPDGNGCCTGETFTDMGADGMNCCPDAGGDCFPPMI